MNNILIFDTNAARKLSKYLREDPSMSDFSNRLHDKGYRYLLSPLVIGELLCHIDKTEKESEFNACYNAIKAIMLLEENEKVRFQFAYPAEIIVAKNFFSENLTNRMEMYVDFLNVAHDIAHKNREEVTTIMTKDNETLSEFYKKMRDEFTENLFNVYDMYISQGKKADLSDDMFYTVASLSETFMLMIHELIAKNRHEPTITALKHLAVMSGNDTELKEHLASVKNAISINTFNIMQYYPTPVALMEIISKKIIDSDKHIKHKKVGNYLQDLMLSFHVSQTFENGEAIFVTDDQDIIAAAVNSHNEQGIMTFETLEHILFD